MPYKPAGFIREYRPHKNTNQVEPRFVPVEKKKGMTSDIVYNLFISRDFISA